VNDIRGAARLLDQLADAAEKQVADSNDLWLLLDDLGVPWRREVDVKAKGRALSLGERINWWADETRRLQALEAPKS